MSWNKTDFEKSYHRAGEKHAIAVKENEADPVDYHSWYERYYRDDGQHPTMDDLVTGRLLTLLAKLEVRGVKAALNELYW